MNWHKMCMFAKIQLQKSLPPSNLRELFVFCVVIQPIQTQNEEERFPQQQQYRHRHRD